MGGDSSRESFDHRDGYSVTSPSGSGSLLFLDAALGYYDVLQRDSSVLDDVDEYGQVSSTGMSLTMLKSEWRDSTMYASGRFLSLRKGSFNL
jgi:hypothetical protein